MWEFLTGDIRIIIMMSTMEEEPILDIQNDIEEGEVSILG